MRNHPAVMLLVIVILCTCSFAEKDLLGKQNSTPHYKQQRVALQLHRVETKPTKQSTSNSVIGERSERDFKHARVPLHGQPVITYHLILQFGSNKDAMWVVVDTGSSNLAIAGPQVNVPQKQVYRYYNPAESRTSHVTDHHFEVTYVQGVIKGVFVTDYVSFANAPEIRTLVEFGVLNEASNFFVRQANKNEPYEGIWGLGYQGIATGGVKPFFDSLVDEGTLQNVFGMQLCNLVLARDELDNRSTMVLGPTPSNTSENGETLYYGEMIYTPIIEEKYYNIRIQGMSVRGYDLDLPCGAFNSPGPSLVDSGTSVTWIPRPAHEALVAYMGEEIISVLDQNQGLENNKTEQQSFLEGNTCKTGDPQLIANLPPITFNFPVDGNLDKQFGVHVLSHHYLRLSKEYGRYCYYFAILPWCIPESGSNLGMSFMNNVFTEFDRENGRIGFATSVCASNVDGPVSTVTASRDIKPSSCSPVSSVQCGEVPSLLNTYLTWAAASFSTIVLSVSLGCYFKNKIGHCMPRRKPSITSAAITTENDNDDDLILDVGPGSDINSGVDANDSSET
eukprot:m.110623 g.110623  ORF g.110623 m.110623 type:complete len:563 (+) comp14045_c0_seq2:211-1899(+)